MPVITLHLEKGWLPDIPPFELPDGGLSDTDLIFPSVLGYRGIDLESSGYDTGYAETEELLGARSFPQEGAASAADVRIFGIDTALYDLYGGSAYTNTSRTQYAANSKHQWQFEKFGDWTIASNGVDPIQICKTGTTFDDLGRDSADVDDVPPVARRILVYGGRLILGDLGPASFRSNEDDVQVGVSWFQYKISGIWYTKTASTNALAAGTIPSDKWGAYALEINAAGTITCRAAAANFTTGYDSEGTAISGLSACPGDESRICYVTVQTKSGNDFVGGTDGLFGGSSGDVAASTNYYQGGDWRSTKMLYWSALEDIEDWVVSTTTGCDRQDMPELRGNITGLQPIHGGFSILAEHSIRIGWLSRGVDVFNFTNARSDVGALPYTSVPVDGGVYFLSQRNAHFFDGQQVYNFGEGWRFTFLGAIGYSSDVITTQYANPTYSRTAIFSVAYHPEEHLIAWNVATGNACPGISAMIIYNIDLKQLVKYKNYDDSTDGYEIKNVYFDYSNNCFAVFRSADSDSKIHEYAINASGTNGELTTKEIAIRDDKGEILTTLIKRVRPRIHGYSATITVTVSSRMNEDDTPTTTTGTLETAKFSGWADVMTPQGRYHKIKTTLSGGVCRSIDVEYEVRGKQ
jgi:hypothetical protein